MIVNLRHYPRVWEQVRVYWLGYPYSGSKRSTVTKGALACLGIVADVIPADEFGCVHMTEEDYVWFMLKWN